MTIRISGRAHAEFDSCTNAVQLRIGHHGYVDYDVFLDDPANSRIFSFHVTPTDVLEQLSFFEDNLPEALSIVQSLQP